ncbi:G protein-coupled receptor 184 [Chanos chanos]|uniref:G protein-coupled receptor 184 n=1 Tax=Chanos chanos TaxID=29144 RepID=A0A6J2VPW0_CHACN|nr:G-protein coupled receptor 4-like [Chanos chanos]
MNKTNETSSNHTCVTIGASPISDLLMAIYILAFTLGLVFNLITIGPIVQQIQSKNVLGVYLLNLSISDLLYVFTMPLWIYYYSNDHKWDLGQYVCSLAGFFYYTNMYLSIYLLCCISVDRCLAVTYPLRSKSFRQMRHAWAVCLILVFVVLSLHLVVLYMDNLKDPLDDRGQRCYETFPITGHLATINLLRVCMGFLIPLLILGVSYWRILIKVWRSSGADTQIKRKVKALSVGVISIFTICFAPYHILLLVRSIAFQVMNTEDYCALEQTLHFPFSCTLALSSLNCLVDPLLYVLVSNGVREDMRLCCWGRRESTLSSSGSQNGTRKNTKLTSLY